MTLYQKALEQIDKFAKDEVRCREFTLKNLKLAISKLATKLNVEIEKLGSGQRLQDDDDYIVERYLCFGIANYRVVATNKYYRVYSETLFITSATD